MKLSQEMMHPELEDEDGDALREEESYKEDWDEDEVNEGVLYREEACELVTLGLGENDACEGVVCEGVV